MKTYYDCIPCFFQHALDVSRMVCSDDVQLRRIINRLSLSIPDFSFSSTPPEMSRNIYMIIRDEMGSDIDPYKHIKKASNELILKNYAKLKEKVNDSKDPLLVSVELAIAGNIIDYGANNHLEIEKEIAGLIDDSFVGLHHRIFEYDQFCEDLNKANKVLYITDNAGEIVFDKLLIEELIKGKEVTVAVRGKAVINDALMEDAYFCGIDKISRVISSGSDAPGTILKYCSDDFLSEFENTDIVISKGQGNYETLNNETKCIYFLFMAKCPVVYKPLMCEKGEGILKRSVFS